MTRRRRPARASLGWHRGTAGGVATLLSLLTLCSAGASPASASPVPVGQALVVLLRDQVAHAGPSLNDRQVARVASRRPLTGVRTVLPVLGDAKGADGRSWVHVSLPGRPNGRRGWITVAGTMPSWTPWRLIVNLNARRVTVYERGQIVRRYPAIVGAPGTPTPQGSFFIEEGVALGTQAEGGPFALATSARSDVLQDFDGGPGQIALHGMDNLAGALGTASSHGCIRLATAAITWLAMRIGPGVPLRILP